MKKHILFATFFSFSLQCAFAQLVLKQIDSHKKKFIPIGSHTLLKLPTFTNAPQDSCDCYYSVLGELIATSKDTVNIIVTETQRVFRDIDGVNKHIFTNLNYPKEKVASSVRLKNLISITKVNRNNEGYKNIGGALMVISLIQGLVINPFMSDNLKKTSAKIMWGTFGTGLTLALIPSKKTYHFQQPKNGKKVKLWQLTTP